MTIKCIEIPDNQKYWFLRTDAGTNYDDFLTNSFIAIGYNELHADKILELGNRKAIKDYLKSIGYKHRNLGLTITNLERFISFMKVGDAVVIPNKKSQTFAFGIVESEIYEATQEDINKGNCKYNKRRKVNWIDEVPSSMLSKSFMQIRFAQGTISSANDYCEHIDNIIGKYFYIKNGVANLVLAAGEDGNIPLQDLSSLLNSILTAAKAVDPNIKPEELQIKISLQSRGTFKLMTSFAVASFLALCFLAAIKEESSVEVQPMFEIPTATASVKASATFKGPSLIKQYSDFKSAELDYQLKELQVQKEKMKVEAMRQQLSQKEQTKTAEKPSGN